MQFFYLANTLCFAVLTLAVPISVKLRDQLIKDKGYDFTMELASKLPQHTPSAVACASFYRICHYTCSTNTKSLPYNLGCTTERTSNRTYTLRTRCTCSLPSSQQDEQERQECRDNPIAKPIEGHTDANVDKGEDLIPREMFDDDYDALGGPALTAKDFARGKEVAATGANGDADTELSAGQFEGDIVLPEGSDEFSMHSKLAEAANNSWTNGIVPYTVSNYLTSKHRSVIAGAIDYIQKRTCVRFTKREHEGDWVHFYAGPGCSSPVGRTGGPQYISLGYGCIQEGIGTVVHEVMHALGFVHEQSRPDRDDYVSIQWDNITQGRCSQFQRIDQELDHTAYDYGSVMHYKTDAFGKLKNGSTTEKKVTVRPLKDAAADFEIGQRRAPSSTDVQRICRRYNCGSNCYPDQLPADKQPVQQDEPDKTFLHRKVSPWRTHYGGVQVRCIVWLCCVVPATLHLPISPKLVASLTKYRNSGFDFTSDVVNSLSEFTPSPVACSSVYRLCHHYCATYTTSQPDKLACKITHTSSKTYILKSRCICSKAFSEQEQDRLAQCKDTPLPVYTFDGKHVENGGLTDEELYPKAMFNTDFEELGGTSLTPEDFARGAAMADKNRSDSADSELQAGQFQGDIVMPEGNDEKNMKATLAAAASNLWIGGIVPYTISNYVTNAHRAAIAGAIAYIQNRTCIRFKEREKEGDWIHYYAGTGCSSSVGRTGGPQFISLSRRCITSIGTPIHETMHALGFFHQQSRPDRDRYVTIVWNNITSFACLQFQKVPQEYYGTTYDYGSVMHYKTNSFGQRVRGVKKTTIRPTRPEAEDAEIGQRNHASKGDITRLCRKYNCGSNCYPDP